MTDFLKQWNEAAPVVFPIRIEKYDYTIEHIKLKCPKCHIELTNLRGRIYEVFDCVESDIVGVCKKCKLVVGHRSRYYPLTGRCLMDGNDGWKEGIMVPFWIDIIINFFKKLHLKLLKMKKFFHIWGNGCG
jgi:hypothetical protein